MIKDWVKEHKKDLLLFLLLFLICSLSFSLGYLVNQQFSHAPIIIEKCSDFISNKPINYTL